MGDVHTFAGFYRSMLKAFAKTGAQGVPVNHWHDLKKD